MNYHINLYSYICVLLACGPDSYGQDCNNACGGCKGYNNCHHVNGTCADGCMAGFKGALCLDGKLLAHYSIW